MKLLLDACVWGGALAALRQQGHDVVWAGEWSHDPGDLAILAAAYAERRTLITIDKDFGALAVVQQQPHAGIVRIVDFPARAQAAAILSVLRHHAQILQDGALITAERGRLRIRPPDTPET